MDKLPTPIELIEKKIAELKKLELQEGEKEHLTELASDLHDFCAVVQARIDKDASGVP